MRNLSGVRVAAALIAVLLTGYLFLCYFIMPELWLFRDRTRVTDLSKMVTTTEQDIPGDPINVGLIGTREQVIRAFAAAGWDPADKITLRSSVEIGLSVVLDRPDLDAPVSALLFEGRKQDLAFEKPVGKSADERHHVRFWKTTTSGSDGRPLWLGSASFDRGVGLSHDTGQITHHIGPDLDADRQLVINDLQEGGEVSLTYEQPGIGATQAGRNGGGDPYFTDGRVRVGVLRPDTVR
ncbi:LssY C-terminal domain-containing protein [Rhizobium sp. LjRoot254]|uniref:LssY C-terminal domain-containing protein n=1 Tax=Rhizobium sp. LjRoot254 TaxID=3342297 RepID=UPI003ECC4E7C